MKKIYSQPRLDSYTQLLNITPKQIINAHHWNSRLCASLYPILQTFELTLRNAIDNAVYTSDNSFYKGDEWWFEKIATVVQDAKIRRMTSSVKRHWLDDRGRRIRGKFGYFEGNIKKARNILREHRRQQTSGAVLSRQSFGFWVGMLDNDFLDIRDEKLLWPNLLSDVFPNAEITVNISTLSKKAKEIKDLRNRISHHEPIWKFFEIKANGQPNYSSPISGIEPSLSRLREHYNSIMEYIKWMSVKAYEEVQHSGFSRDFEKLCSLEGFKTHINKRKSSAIRGRLLRVIK